jgi:hypothetical protein
LQLYEAGSAKLRQAKTLMGETDIHDLLLAHRDARQKHGFRVGV